MHDCCFHVAVGGGGKVVGVTFLGQQKSRGGRRHASSGSRYIIQKRDLCILFYSQFLSLDLDLFRRAAVGCALVLCAGALKVIYDYI
jgi:hypothetical protein